MGECCAETACELDKLRGRQARVLVWVLAINATMFVVEMTAGVLASSTSLVADSLDMLGDALVYALSLFVVGRDLLWKALAARVKGFIMVGFGLSVLGHTTHKLLFPQLPEVLTIETIGVLALVANATCLGLLWRHRGDDVNMRSIWLCSRNDIIANLAVLVAGGGVWLTHSQLPDIVIGLAIAALFLKSALTVLRESAAARARVLAP